MKLGRQESLALFSFISSQPCKNLFSESLGVVQAVDIAENVNSLVHPPWMGGVVLISLVWKVHRSIFVYWNSVVAPRTSLHCRLELARGNFGRGRIWLIKARNQLYAGKHAVGVFLRDFAASSLAGS